MTIILLSLLLRPYPVPVRVPAMPDAIHAVGFDPGPASRYYLP